MGTELGVWGRDLAGSVGAKPGVGAVMQVSGEGVFLRVWELGVRRH